MANPNVMKAAIGKILTYSTSEGENRKLKEQEYIRAMEGKLGKAAKLEAEIKQRERGNKAVERHNHREAEGKGLLPHKAPKTKA